jgi:hypothetical protein
MAFPPRLLESVFDVQQSIARIKEYQIYKNERRDPNAREIFWGRIESLRFFLEKVFTTIYYENLACNIILDLFLILFQLFLREVPALLDDILTPTLDRLLRTNIRKLHKSGANTCPIFVIYDHILMNHTTKLIQTSKYLEKYDPDEFSSDTLNEYSQWINQLSRPTLQSDYQKKKQSYYHRVELPPLTAPVHDEGAEAPSSSSSNLPPRSLKQNKINDSSPSSSSSLPSLPPVRVMIYKHRRR